MPFEREGGDSWSGRSPGGFEFGIQGFAYGPPIPKSVTFFLDGSALVADQYGNRVRGVVLPDGRPLLFADRPPDASKEDSSGGPVVPRPQFATHLQVVEALAAERIDWLAYEVHWRGKDSRNHVRGGMTLEVATKYQTKLLQEGNTAVTLGRAVVCAGWPQLPYDKLKELPELPQTPIAELKKIRDPELRRDALRIRREADQVREKELQAIADE